MSGYYFKRRDRIRLLKQNKAYEPVDLRSGDMVVGVISYVAWRAEELAGPDISDEDDTTRSRSTGR